MSLRAARAPVGAPPPAPAGARNTLKDVLALSMGRVALDTEGNEKSRNELKGAIEKRQRELSLKTQRELSLQTQQDHKVALMFSPPYSTETGFTFPVEVCFLEQKPAGDVSEELSEIFGKDIIPQISKFIASLATVDYNPVLRNDGVSGFVQEPEYELSAIVDLLLHIQRFQTLSFPAHVPYDVTSNVALRSDDKTRATLRRTPRFTVHVQLQLDKVFDVELFGLMIADKIHDYIDSGRPAPAPDNNLANGEEPWSIWETNDEEPKYRSDWLFDGPGEPKYRSLQG